MRLLDLNTDYLLGIMRVVYNGADGLKNICKLSMTCKRLQSIYQEKFFNGTIPQLSYLSLELFNLIAHNFNNDPKSIVRLSWTSRQFQTIYNDRYRNKRKSQFLVSCIFAGNGELCSEFYAILNKETNLNSQILIATPKNRNLWLSLKNNPIKVELIGQARQEAIIQKFYINGWDLLLRFQKKQDAKAMLSLLLNTLPHINNPMGYASDLFGNKPPQEKLLELANIHLDRCLQLAAKVFHHKDNDKVFREKLELPIREGVWKIIREGEYPSFLHYTLANFHKEDDEFTTLLNRLFDKGCDLEQKNKSGETALSYFLKLGYTKKRAAYQKALIMRLIERGADCNAKDEEGNTPLMIIRQAELINLLLKYEQVNVQARNHKGLSILVNAIQFKELPVVQALIDHPRIDINNKDDQGWTALMYASANNKFQIVEQLLQHKKIAINKNNLINMLNKENENALHIALKKCHWQVAEILLKDARIDINITNGAGWNALMYVVSVNNSDESLRILELLLNHEKIDVNAKNHNGLSAADIAVDKNAFKSVSALFKHARITAKVCFSAFAYAFLKGKDKEFKRALEEIELPNKASFIKEVLELARQENHMGIVTSLVKILEAICLA